MAASLHHTLAPLARRLAFGRPRSRGSGYRASHAPFTPSPLHPLTPSSHSPTLPFPHSPIRPLLAAALLAAAVPAWADGGIFVSGADEGFSADQRALLVYDPETATETMAVSTRYIGSPGYFAWVLPVPNLPTRDQVGTWDGGEEALAYLSRVAEPRATSYTGGCAPVGCGMAGGSSAPAGGGVDVVDRLTINGLDISLLAAHRAADLTDWLNTNGYRFPNFGTGVLDFYVGKGWGFVAVKVDPEAPAGAATASIAGYFPEEPLKITFHSDQPVFPMRISSVSGRADGSIVLLYVLTRHRVRATSFPTVQATAPTGSFTSEGQFATAYAAGFQKLLDQPAGRALVVEYAAQFTHAEQYLPPGLEALLGHSQSYYLTRLRTLFRPQDMSDDIVLAQDDSDTPFNVYVSSRAQPPAQGALLALALAAATFAACRASGKAAGAGAARWALFVGVLACLALGAL